MGSSSFQTTLDSLTRLLLVKEGEEDPEDGTTQRSFMVVAHRVISCTDEHRWKDDVILRCQESHFIVLRRLLITASKRDRFT